MTRKTGGSGKAVAYWRGSAERKSGVLPAQMERKPWAAAERTRILNSQVDPDNGPATVWVEHRSEPGLVFKVELTSDGTVVGFQARPLVFRSEQAGNLTVYEIDEETVPPGAEHLTARRIRALPAGEVCGAAAAGVRSQLGWLLARSTDWGTALKNKRRPGSGGRSDLFYADLAAEYVLLIESGTANVVQEIARTHYLNARTVSNLLYEARRRGLLTKPPRGRAGGTLTDKALELLKAKES